MEAINALRRKIDEIDIELQRLFIDRMETVRAIANVKLKNDMTVYDRDRERQVIEANMARIEESPYADYYRRFLENVMQLSKDYQKSIVRDNL